MVFEGERKPVKVFDPTTGAVRFVLTGVEDPQVDGVRADIGSLFLRSNGSIYAKMGPLNTDWTLVGLEGGVAPHKNTHVSGGTDAFVDTDLIDARIRNILESGGPTALAVMGIPDGTFLMRSGTDVVGSQPPPITETDQYLPFPNEIITGQSTRSARESGQDMEGAVYRIDRPVQFNRIISRVTGAGPALSTYRILIYQQADGLSGVADLVATFPGIAGDAVGNIEAGPPTQGTVTLVQGICYIVYARDDLAVAGAITMRTFTNQNIDLLNGNVPATVYPTSFTFTGVDADDPPPATLDPSAVAANNANLDLVVRLRRV